MMGGIEAGKAYVKFLLDDGQFKKSLAGVGSKLKAIGTVGMAVSAPIVGMFTAAAFAASDAQETMSKFSTVFGNQAAAMKTWGDNLANTVGRSKYEVAGMLASFQDLLVPMGMNAQGAGDMSKQLAQLAIDLASFNNLQDAAVAGDLAGALTGSGEVMKKYGVILNEAAVKQELLNMKLDPKTATEAEKAQARLNIIMRGTTAAQGDAARTADGFANRMKALKSKLHDASVALGDALLPHITKFVDKLGVIVDKVAVWIEQNPELVEKIALVAAGVGAASAAVIGLGAALTLVTLHPIVAFLALVAGAVAYTILSFDNWHDRIHALLKLLGPLGYGLSKIVELSERMGFNVLPESTKEKSSPFDLLAGDSIHPEMEKIQAETKSLQAKVQTAANSANASLPATAKIGNDATRAAAVTGVNAKMAAGIAELVKIQGEALRIMKTPVRGGFRVGTS
jgi:hypothetical protein